ncbi:Adenosylcobalamin biosynthesis, ATP:cob(I)alamin adenosyltransferase-like protein [Zychaea mexicana]|uniref:Adenosylcobalamin biosynthesis, ATP:cob(I)alamin adenosyltransferase-like protein n=1 Tax=Zychaea mexicana TaxID=64656 RepID=UPI0022FE164D|nr:Adenosylcobalamin biosynthesis, ATP:cob(I)alamin adenosyltransferase-like protein [Zychaea mexicana]KAI9497081.1 Adenosylcobalamin biosynthesis, ATP:cob(I)alamin adenosyltransferase-like protein [Zychaea mexicana]
MRIYTKTGDKGTSSLYNGERRDKDDLVFEALGTTDELTSNLGLALEFCEEQNNVPALCEQILWIQCMMQDIGANIATPRENSNERKLAKTVFDEEGKEVAKLEQYIDAMTAELPRLTQFILPSGGRASATLHVARGISRRAERRVSPLVRENMVDNSVGIFMNRLSDYLFTAARYASMKAEKPEKIYK